MGDSDTTYLEPEYESEDAIPEGQRDFYRAKDGDAGGFELNLNPEAKRRLEDTGGLRRTIASTRSERDRYRREAGERRARIEELESEIAELRDGKPGGEDKDKGKGGAPDAGRLAQLEAKHQQEIAKERQLVERRTQQLTKTLRDDTILRMLPKGADPKILNMLRPYVRAIVQDDGSLAVKVFDGEESTSPRISQRENSTDDMTPEEFMREIVPREFAAFLPGPGSTGGGSGGSDTPGSAGRAPGGQVTISREDARDTDKYRAAKARAEKAGVKLTILD